eukprot:TRINITY_DN34058_c0_g1_i1.p1 TRINITY_DN34058_c0_g1~~TRINITY_DN34058_c0_g1_i1.p1  ORF type:complete len:543 (+),score=114.58 TRINITY_DN34058_c0_g1_i1:47-1630(+)
MPPKKEKRKRDDVQKEQQQEERNYLRMILTAPVYDVAKESSLQEAKSLSQRVSNKVFLKREDEQQVFSFKLRGAYNKMVNLTKEELSRGVVACSAGNHAQGVALAAKKLNTSAIICMPTCTPGIKVDNVKRLGAEVRLKGLSFDEAKTECMKICDETGRVLIHPYDDPYVIAGQGTIAVEIFRQLSSETKPDIIFSCIGGGGLIAGILLYTKRVFPSCKVIGVEANDANAMQQSLAAGKVKSLETVGLFADGAAVKTVGEETFRIAKECGLDDCITVTNDEICAAIKDIFEDTRSIVEPAGALAVAGMKRYMAEHSLSGKNVVCITSGANMNFNRLRFVSERAEIGEDREALMSVIIPEEKGAFQKMSNCIFPHQITEFSYRFRPGGKAYILVAFSSEQKSVTVPEVIKKLSEVGMTAHDVTDNELAKSHGRYLAGGRHKVDSERLISFEFPEQAGSRQLEKFLLKLQEEFYITLLHYRNQGSGTGRVLVGTPVPNERKSQFQEFANKMGYTFRDETNNPVYKSFLC